MAIPQREQNLLFLKSGGLCAFTGCKRPLASESSPSDGVAILGEMAHIIAERPNGPRGNSPLPLSERNKYDNLVLLCNIHHQLIDDKPQTYTVERLHQMKQEHEEWVEKTLRRGRDDGLVAEPPNYTTEIVYSTLLPVERMPQYVYGAPCEFRYEKEVKEKLRFLTAGEIAPFILREGILFAFQNLGERKNLFHEVVDTSKAHRYLARTWWSDPDRMGWFIQLLNRTLNKITGHRGLHFDRDHKRYYFPPKEVGEEREVTYRPLNAERATRKVVWQPMNKATGEGRGYWYHRAVSLQFFRLAAEDWCLSIRPELHLTADSVRPFASEKIGARVTRKKSRTFNYDLLGDVQFWRDYLSDSSPRIIGRFGTQSIIILTALAHGEITWPGIPEEHAKPFRNVVYLDTAESWAERLALDEEQEDYDSEDDDVDWQAPSAEEEGKSDIEVELDEAGEPGEVRNSQKKDDYDDYDDLFRE